MITGVFGLQGAGKTTFLVYAAICGACRRDLSAGRAAWRVPLCDFRYDRVYTNFPCVVPKKYKKKQKVPIYQLNIDDLGKKDFSNALIIIDEISLCLDSRNYKEFKQEIKEFFALARHYCCDVIYASQSYDHADKRIRDITSVLLYVDKFGGWSRVRPIHKQWSIDGTITEGFQLAPPLSSLWLRRKSFYTAFDSWAAPVLPANDAEMWEYFAAPSKL